MTSEAPIGVFDSGVGGLTVVAELRRRLPAEHIIYLGDTARLPYGSKSPEVVARYTQRNVEVLVQRGVKAVVVACNSASAMALDELEAAVPVWGVIEPGAATAVASGARRIGVLATEATVLSGAYPRAIERRDAGILVAQQACPLLVPLVEEGWAEDPVTEEVIRRYLEPLFVASEDPHAAGAPDEPITPPEALVLGCTHYPLLCEAIARVADGLGASPQLVDSAEAVTDAVELGLRELGLARAGDGVGTLRLLVTDPSPRLQRIAEEILGAAPELEWVDIQL